MSATTVVLEVEKGIEVGAEVLLGWLAGSKASGSTTTPNPAALAALAVLLGAVGTAIGDVTGAIENPVNIVLDVQTAEDVAAVWPDIKTFAAALGIKL